MLEYSVVRNSKENCEQQKSALQGSLPFLVFESQPKASSPGLGVHVCCLLPGSSLPGIWTGKHCRPGRILKSGLSSTLLLVSLQIAAAGTVFTSDGLT